MVGFDAGVPPRKQTGQIFSKKLTKTVHLSPLGGGINCRSRDSTVILEALDNCGRAYEIPVPSRLPSRWSIQVRSLFDFERLQWIESDWEMMLLKISQQKKTLSSRGIEFITPDDATLYGLWLNDMYRLDVLQLSGLPAGDVKELRNGNPTCDLQMAADRTRPHTLCGPVVSSLFSFTARC